MIVVYILIFILVLGLVVCFHELGHYFWAKKFGILVNEFAFGMGPKIVSKKKGETYWSIRAFPVGGFCAMSGEEVGDPLLKEGDQVKLVLDENNKVSKVFYFKDAEGRPVESYEHDMKLWWPHNEGIVASLLFFKTTGKEEYAKWFKTLTKYAFDHFSEREYGEWYGYLRRDGKPTMPPCKGCTYKGPFHVMRCLASVLCIFDNKDFV